MNLAVKFNLLKDTQPHYIYKPESCLENDNYKLYFDRTVLTDIHIQHNRPDIIILNKQQKQAYLLDIAVPNSHNITQTYNTKINKYLELSVAMRNLWCLEKNSILPFIISATGIVPQSLFKNLKILDLENTLVVEIQKGILLLESGFLVFMLFVGVISSSILFEMCNRLKILSHLSPILLCFFCFFCSFMHIKMYMLIYCLFPYL
jgi:hypothetical protein